MSSVAEALVQARQRGVDRLDAQLLLARQLGRDRAWLLAHDDAPLADAVWLRFREAVARRADGEPLAYILGEKEFHGLLLQVDKRVLVPRPDTELLVDWALELLPASSAADVVDLGTGSGAIALALKHRRPAALVTATDADAGALAVAQINTERLGLAITLRRGHWWGAVPEQRFALALSNPPYIAQGDAHLAALHHEPTVALTPGPAGLESLHEIVRDAPAHLLPGAWLLLEHGFDQAPTVQDLLRERGFAQVSTRKDLAGHDRCTGGRL